MLGGNAKTWLIINLSPSFQDIHETVNTVTSQNDIGTFDPA